MMTIYALLFLSFLLHFFSVLLYHVYLHTNSLSNISVHQIFSLTCTIYLCAARYFRACICAHIFPCKILLREVQMKVRKKSSSPSSLHRLRSENVKGDAVVIAPIILLSRIRPNCARRPLCAARESRYI